MVRPLQHDVLGHCQIAPGLRFAELVQDTEGVGTGDQGLQAPVGHRHPADLTVLPALSQAAQDLIEVGGVTQGPLLAAVGGEEQGPVPVLPDEGALLVEEDHHVLPAAQGPQGIIYRQLEEEFIHGALVGDLPADGKVQLAQVLHAEQWRLGGGEGLGQQQAGLIGLIVGSGFHGGLLSERAGPGPGGRCLFSIVDAFFRPWQELGMGDEKRKIVIQRTIIVIQKKENVLKGTRLLAKIPRKYLQGICKIGIPTAIQGMAYCAISMVLTRMISGYGAEAVATQRVGGQIESISWNTADGFAAALNAFIAQNYGAGKNDRVKKGYKASLWTVGIWGLLISAVFICIPEPIARIFFHEPKAIATSVEYLIIIGFSEAFMCVELMTVGALSGLGRTRLCSIISIAFTSARIPLSIILGGIMGLDGIWWAISSTSIVKGIIFTCTFLWITRKRR